MREVRAAVDDAPRLRLAGGHDEPHGVLRDGVVHEDAVDRPLRADQLVQAQHLLGVRP